MTNNHRWQGDKHMIYKNINIYNIFLRSVENNKSLQLTIERAKDMGFDTIYFNPFFKTGKSKSIYSITDYYNFDFLSFDKNAEPKQQVKEIVALCNKNNLRPIIDLVINHTAIDSELIKSNPNFYCYANGNIKIASGRDIGKTVIWHDLAQLDYNNLQSGLWDYMLGVCNYYVSLGFRGFRCDASDQVASTFWTWLISKIKSTDPDILFIGEAFLCSTKVRIDLAYAGFDYIYNSAKWWDYKSDWLLEEYNSTYQYISTISFPDNHDTQRLMKEVEGNTRLFLQHLYFTAFWSQGFQITAGTEFGVCEQLNCVTTRRSHQEITQYDFTKHIKELLKVRKFIFNRSVDKHKAYLHCLGYEANYPQKIVYENNLIQIINQLYSLIVDLKKTEIKIELSSFSDDSYIGTFNCIDSQPETQQEFSWR